MLLAKSWQFDMVWCSCNQCKGTVYAVNYCTERIILWSGLNFSDLFFVSILSTFVVHNYFVVSTFVILFGCLICGFGDEKTIRHHSLMCLAPLCIILC